MTNAESTSNTDTSEIVVSQRLGFWLLSSSFIVFFSVITILLLVFCKLDNKSVATLLFVFPIAPVFFSGHATSLLADYRINSLGIEQSPPFRKRRLLRWTEIEQIRLRPPIKLVGERTSICIAIGALDPQKRHDLWQMMQTHIGDHFDLTPPAPRRNSGEIICPSKPAYIVAAIIFFSLVACAWWINHYPAAQIAYTLFYTVSAIAFLLVIVVAFNPRTLRRFEVSRDRIR